MKTISKKVIVMALVAALICALCTVAAFAATSDNAAANATAVTETAQTAVDTAGSATGSKAVAARFAWDLPLRPPPSVWASPLVSRQRASPANRRPPEISVPA